MRPFCLCLCCQGETPKNRAEKAQDSELAAYLENRQHYQMIQREDQETAVWRTLDEQDEDPSSWDWQPLADGGIPFCFPGNDSSADCEESCAKPDRSGVMQVTRGDVDEVIPFHFEALSNQKCLWSREKKRQFSWLSDSIWKTRSLKFFHIKRIQKTPSWNQKWSSAIFWGVGEVMSWWNNTQETSFIPHNRITFLTQRKVRFWNIPGVVTES